MQTKSDMFHVFKCQGRAHGRATASEVRFEILHFTIEYQYDARNVATTVTALFIAAAVKAARSYAAPAKKKLWDPRLTNRGQ